MKLENVKKFLFVFIIFHFKYTFVRTTGNTKQPGWFTQRNYTSHCHGGSFESGISEKKSNHMGIAIFIDNETRCTLKKKGSRMNQYYGIVPPKIILPGDCGVFWGGSESINGLFGWNHYMCEEYGVLIALEFIIPRHSSNKYGLWARGFGRGENIIHVDYDAPSRGNVVTFNIFISEKKRFCPCADTNELASNKYKYN